MKRLEFLKKLGIGVATVIVAPKIIAEIPEKEVWHTGGIIPKLRRQGMTGMTNSFSEFLRKHPMPEHPCPVIWDRCLDREGEEWIVVEKWLDRIVLIPVMSTLAGPKPVKMTVRIDRFDKMFTITHHIHNENL